MIGIKQRGNFNNLSSFLEKSREALKIGTLDTYGKEGVAALKAATPKDTGKTSESWYYQIIRNDNFVALTFHNSNVVKGVPIAIVLQYGHATRNGGYVEGIDYINPTLKPILNKISKELWKEVTK